MATHRTAKIPFNRIIKVGIYNNQSKKATLSTIYTELKNKYPGKEVYINNCGFFNMATNWTACFGLKMDGKIYGNDWQWGTMAMKDNKITFVPPYADLTPYTDAVTGFPVLIENGQKSRSFSHCIDNSDRGRTMVGYTKDAIVMSCIGDTAGTSDFTLDEELNYMLSQGCLFAINLDGGGSSQCNYNGSTITSSRKVHNFLYTIVEPEKIPTPSTPAPSDPKYTQKAYQTWLNSNYKSGLTIDGSLGPASLKASIKALQREMGATETGVWDTNSKNKYKYLGLKSPYNTINKLKILQGLLCRKGYWTGAIDGVLSEALVAQIKKFQSANKLAMDGCVGPATIAILVK